MTIQGHPQARGTTRHQPEATTVIKIPVDLEARKRRVVDAVQARLGQDRVQDPDHGTVIANLKEVDGHDPGRGQDHLQKGQKSAADINFVIKMVNF